MNTNSVHQSIIDRQCFLAAQELIQEVLVIKGTNPEQNDLLSSPRIKDLLRKLDSWTDYLSMEGGL